MAKEFPTQKYDGDITGTGTSADLVKQLGSRRNFIEIRLVDSIDNGYLKGTFGQLQTTRDYRIDMSVLFMSDSEENGLEIPVDFSTLRTILDADRKIEWVIHPELE
jgi:hypothetical protein